MLEELEETYLAPTLQTVIEGMQAQVPNLYFQSSGTALSSGVLDADHFLAAAQSLITGTTDYGSLGQDTQTRSYLVPGTFTFPSGVF